MQPFAELGVLFVLFLIGLGLPVRRLFEMRRLVLGLGSAQVLATAAAIGVVAFAYGAKPGVAIAIGLGFALSSTAVVSQILIEQRRPASSVGRTAMAILLFQDAMVVPIVIVIGLLARGLTPCRGGDRRGGLASPRWRFIVVAGRFLVTPLVRLAARNAGREAVVAIALFVAVGLALITNAVGLSTALGAFLAGLLIGESEYRHQVEVDIEPFKALLLGLFFMTVGMSFDPALLATSFATVLVSVIGLIALKALVTFPLARLFGVKRPVAAEVAVLLAGAGEFAFVVLTLARDAGLVSPRRTSSSSRSPRWRSSPRRCSRRSDGRSAARLERAPGATHTPDGEAAEYADHVVIGGFGRIGRLVADVLDAERISYVGLDLDADLVALERAAGRPVFYGDPTRREILERVGGERARAFVVTTDAAEAEEEMVKAIRAAWPSAVIHARAKDQTHAARLIEIGAHSAVPEALDASLQLAAQVLAAEGMREATIASRIARQRRIELEQFTRSASPPPKAKPSRRKPSVH